MKGIKFVIGLVCLGFALLTAAPPAAKAALNDWDSLSGEEANFNGVNYRGVFDATNFTGISTSAPNAFFPKYLTPSVTFPKGTRIRNVAVRVITPFQNADGTLTACLLSLGDGANSNRFGTVAVGTNANINAANSAGFWYNLPPTNHVYNVATNMTINLTPTPNGFDVTGLVTGRVEIYFQAVPLSRLSL